MIKDAQIRGPFGFRLRGHGGRILAGELDVRIVITTLTPTAPSHLTPTRDAFGEQERLSDAARHAVILAGNGDINFHSCLNEGAIDYGKNENETAAVMARVAKPSDARSWDTRSTQRDNWQRRMES